VRLEILKALSQPSNRKCSIWWQCTQIDQTLENDQLAGSAPYSMIIGIISHLRPDNPPLRRAGLEALSNLARFSKAVNLVEMLAG